MSHVPCRNSGAILCEAVGCRLSKLYLSIVIRKAVQEGYVCGQIENDCDKAVAGGAIYSHNADWDINPLRCPMELTKIEQIVGGVQMMVNMLLFSQRFKLFILQEAEAA